MLLVLLLAVWLGRQVNKAREQRVAVSNIARYGGWVHYDYEVANGKVVGGRSPRAPEALRRQIGDEYFRDIVRVSLVYDDTTGKRFETTNIEPADKLLASLRGMTKLKELLLQGSQATDEGLKHVGAIASLEELYIWNAAEITDAGIAHLKDLKRLRVIHLDHSRVTDRALGALAQLPALEEMALQSNQFTDRGLDLLRGNRSLKKLCVGLGQGKITDAGMEPVATLANLELLDIQGSEVTDAGLERLEAMPNLKEIWASRTRITAGGANRIKAKRPNLKISGN